MTIRFNFCGAEIFLSHLRGQIAVRQVLEHPAYQTVARHAQMFGNGICAQDVVDAIAGRPSPFFGLDELSKNLSRVITLMDDIRQHEMDWVAAIEGELHNLLPDENLEITIFPILGYDMGIGLNGAVCMNLNCNAYLGDSREFLFYAIHECMHVVYERHHPIPALANIQTPSEWRSYFNLWTHNEGFAVYAPLKLREKLGCLEERDYRVLFNASQLESHRMAFRRALETLENNILSSRDEYLEICFGDMRLTYRLGCELLRRIARAQGQEAVRQAFFLDADHFMKSYKHLLVD
jgi:hypothetical protein